MAHLGPNARRISTEGSGASLEEILRDPHSPFLALDTPMTAYEWLKLVISPPIILIRSVLVLLILPPVWLYLLLLTTNMPVNSPLPRWRAVVLLPVLRFWGYVLLCLGFFLVPRVRGRENLKEAERLRALLVFNHVSYLDALLIFSIFAPCGLAKAGVASIPFFGRVAKAFQFFFVQRAGTTDPAVDKLPGRQGSTQAVHERAADPRFPLFAIGPEGTTKHSNYLLQFSTGAFVGGRPVVPILLEYKCRHFNVGWGVIENVYWHFWRIQSQFANYCEIRVLKPYIPTRAEREDPRLYAENVRVLMAKEMDARLSPYGIPEQQMLKRAGYCVDRTGRYILQKQANGRYQRVELKRKKI